MNAGTTDLVHGLTHDHVLTPEARTRVPNQRFNLQKGLLLLVCTYITLVVLECIVVVAAAAATVTSNLLLIVTSFSFTILSNTGEEFVAMNLSVISDSSVVVMCWVCSTKFDTRIKIG